MSANTLSGQKTHASPLLSGEGFPTALSCTNKISFCSARELNGVDIYFRQTREGTGHLTSLLVFGHVLLDYAVQKLKMTELVSWKLIEKGFMGRANGM